MKHRDERGGSIDPAKLHIDRSPVAYVRRRQRLPAAARVAMRTLLVMSLAAICVGSALVYDGLLYVASDVFGRDTFALASGRIYRFDWYEIGIGVAFGIAGFWLAMSCSEERRRRLILPAIAVPVGVIVFALMVGEVKSATWFTTNETVRSLESTGKQGPEFQIRQRYFAFTRIEDGRLKR